MTEEILEIVMPAPRTLYEILDLRPDATQSDVEAGYQRALEVFSEDSLASYALFTPDEADRVRKEIQMAYSVLRHGPSRSAYDAALAAATDKAAATLSFTTIWEQGASSLSDSTMGTPLSTRRPVTAEKPAEAAAEPEAAAVPTSSAPAGTRSSTGRMLVIAPPVEDVPAAVDTVSEELPPLPPPAPLETAPVVATPSSVPVSLSPTEPPAPAPGLSAYPTIPPTEFHTLVPPSVAAPTEPPSAVPMPAPAAPPPAAAPVATPVAAAPAPVAPPAPVAVATPAPAAAPTMSNPPGGPRFKRVRVDDDAIAANIARAVVGPVPSATSDAPLELPADGEINGSVLQRLREARNMDLRTMAGITKVGINYLRAIEANDFGELPARVYLRGFLIQYARALRVNPERLAGGYLAFADRYRKEIR
ncbi:MAG: helix-turn-helix domain-containing protein [Myxococcota bacterium]